MKKQKVSCEKAKVNDVKKEKKNQCRTVFFSFFAFFIFFFSFFIFLVLVLVYLDPPGLVDIIYFLL